MEDTKTDVPVADETAPDSSAADQTPADATEVVQDQPEAPEAPAKTVPYERFKEVNDEVKTMKQKLAEFEAKLPRPQVDQQTEAVKAQLKALGFVSQEEVQATLAQQQEDARVERELASLETTYSGKDGRPKFNRNAVLEYAIKHSIPDPELAYKAMNESALIDWHIKTATSKTGGVKTEASDGSGSTQVGTTTEDLKAAIAKGDRGALHTFLKRLK